MNEHSLKDATAVYNAIEIDIERFALHRNGIVMHSPGGGMFAVPTEALAEAIVQEWRMQKPGKLDPASMPMTQLAVSALDKAMVARVETIKGILAFAQSDTLLHRAPAYESLATRQEQIWQPLLDWFAEQFGARLVAGEGLMPLEQPQKALHAAHTALESFDAFFLAGIGHICRLTGSLVLATVLASHRLDATQVFRAAELESLSQIDRWGEDENARLRLSSVQHDIEQGERWFKLLARP